MSWITRRDLAYWLTIAVIVNVGIYTKFLGSNETILSYISFAGTIVSILLGLIAIIYAFVQTATNVNTSSQLAVAASDVRTTVAQLRSVTDGINESTQQLRAEVIDAVAGTKETIGAQIEQLQAKLLSSLTNNETTTDQPDVDKLSLNIPDLVDAIKTSPWTAQGHSMLTKAYRNQVPLNLKESLTRNADNAKSKLANIFTQAINFGSVMTLVKIYQILGLIKVSSTDEHITVEQMDESLL